MKKVFLSLFLIIGFSLYAQSFEWTLGLVDYKQSRSLDFSRPVNLKRGDAVNILVQSSADCWLYIIAQDSDRNVVVFHSGRIRAGEAYRSNPIQILPPSGQDTIYIIVSRNQEKNLEERIAAYTKDNEFRNGRNVVSAVLEMRREILSLAEAPDKPVPLGGAFRSYSDFEGRNYSGTYRYFKTILLNH